MAKEDFCFTYYDGDAARDKAHMNRLERGAYDDIISAIRKRGHLSLDDIKKVLGKDFETCWEALEWVLKSDAAGLFFIEWLDNSINQMREQSKKQKERVSKRWSKDGNDPVLPKEYHGITAVIPKIEDEDEDEDGDEKKEGGTGETNLPVSIDQPAKNQGIVHQIVQDYRAEFPNYHHDPEKDFPAALKIAYSIGKDLKINKHQVTNGSAEQVRLRWGEILLILASDSWYRKKALSYIAHDFQQVMQLVNNENNGKKVKQNSSYQPVITGAATGAGAL